MLRDEWWKKATPERIGVAYEAASAWAQYDDVARQAADRIRDEVKQRYDVDVDDLARDALIVRTPPQEVAAGTTSPTLAEDRAALAELAREVLGGRARP